MKGEFKMNDEILCPFCEKAITIFIGDKCGSEPNGYHSINHTCDSGLFIEWFEEGHDTTDTIRAISQRGRSNV